MTSGLGVGISTYINIHVDCDTDFYMVELHIDLGPTIGIDVGPDLGDGICISMDLTSTLT
jgi:hypothetical protein